MEKIVYLFHAVHSIECKTARRIHVVRGAADTSSQQHQGPIMCGQTYCQVCRMLLNEEKNSSGLFEKPKLDNARQLRHIYLIDPAFSLSILGWNEIKWKEAKSRSHAEDMDDTRCDLGEPTSFLDHVYLGCTQRAWKPDDSVVDENRKMFGSWIYICQSEWKVAWLREIACEHDRLVLWHGRTCVQRYCEMANKTMEQFVLGLKSSLGWPSIQKKARIGNSGSICQRSALKSSWNACTCDAVEDQTFFGRYTNWHEQSQNGACDKRLALLIPHIHSTSDYRQYCHVGNTAQHWRVGLLGGFWSCWRPRRLNIDLGENLVYLQESNIRSHTLDVQEANFHSSTESDVVSLDAGLRMDGILALDLWGFGCWSITCSFESIQSTKQPVARKALWKYSNERTKKQTTTSDDLAWTIVHYVTPNNSEAVI